MDGPTDLIKYVPIDTLLAKYDELKTKVNDIFDSIKYLENEIDIVLGNTYYVVDTHLLLAGREPQIKRLTQNFWKYTFNKLQLYNLMSEKKKSELDKQFENNEFPEYTRENVLSTFKTLTDNVKSLMDDTILEAFEILRPHNDHYKTNTQYEVGKRAILDWMISSWKWHGKLENPSLNYRNEQKLRSLDNAFSLMDGCGPAMAPYDSITILKQAIKDRTINCETKYFKYKWYMKGSLHVEFKRMDLVAKMNAIGGKGLLNKEKEAA